MIRSALQLIPRDALSAVLLRQAAASLYSHAKSCMPRNSPPRASPQTAQPRRRRAGPRSRHPTSPPARAPSPARTPAGRAAVCFGLHALQVEKSSQVHCGRAISAAVPAQLSRHRSRPSTAQQAQRTSPGSAPPTSAMGKLHISMLRASWSCVSASTLRGSGNSRRLVGWAGRHGGQPAAGGRRRAICKPVHQQASTSPAADGGEGIGAVYPLT